MKTKKVDDTVNANVNSDPESQVSSSDPIVTPDNSLSADDILFSCGTPLTLEVPELPKNGKPGIIHFKRPSAEVMISFWSSRKENAGEDGVDLNREAVMSSLIGMLAVQSDGITPLFTPEQIAHIKDARYDVWQRLASHVDSIIKPIAANATMEGSQNPFEETTN